MDFDRLIQPGRLAEKPWKADAFFRLVVAIVFCYFAGAAVATVIRYFGEPHHTATLRVLWSATGAFTCFVGAICVLVSPWAFDHFLRNLLALLLFTYGGFILMWVLLRQVDKKGEIGNPAIAMLIGILALQGMVVVLAHFFLREHHTGWGEGFGFNIDTKYAVLVGTIAGLCALPATWGLEMISNFALQWLATHHLTTHLPQEQEAVQILRSTEGWQNRLVLGLTTIVIAPVGEEIFFRGILYPFIKRIGFPRLAWWVTALVFAAAHANLATFVPLAFLAFV